MKICEGSPEWFFKILSNSWAEVPMGVDRLLISDVGYRYFCEHGIFEICSHNIESKLEINVADLIVKETSEGLHPNLNVGIIPYGHIDNGRKKSQ